MTLIYIPVRLLNGEAFPNQTTGVIVRPADAPRGTYHPLLWDNGAVITASFDEVTRFGTTDTGRALEGRFWIGARAVAALADKTVREPDISGDPAIQALREIVRVRVREGYYGLGA